MIAGTLAGMLYGGFAGFARYQVLFGVLVGVLVGAFNGFVLSGLISAVEVFGPRTSLGRALERAPFLVTVAVKGLAYGSLITVVIAGELGMRLLGIPDVPSPRDDALTPLSVVFSFALTFLFLFVIQMIRIVGGRTLANIVLGRYHRPRAEDRFFLFVDVMGSTPLAERLGPTHVHRFLDRVFRLASDPIDDHRGEVYQYVGDEIVVTWTLATGRLGARPIACFFAIERALAAAAPRFLRDFGALPRVRGALHAGGVVTGEVGESRRAIVFHGDVMNTASRLEHAARDLGRRFLVSADAIERMAPEDLSHGRYVVEDLGLQRLRGRETPVRVFAADVGRDVVHAAQALSL